MGSIPSGAPADTAEASGTADLLAAAAKLRWARPDLTGALADHVFESAAAAHDRGLWLAAAGWALHARSATGDGREKASEVLERLPRWGATPLAGPAAHRLRVELALVAVEAGEVDRARELLGPVLVEGTAPVLRADALTAWARCAVEDGSESLPALRRAETAWSEVPGPGKEVGAAGVALVAAAAYRRAGRADDAADAASAGLTQLERGRESEAADTPSGHLAAALAAEWISALLDAGRIDEARQGCEPLVPRLGETTRPSRQLARLRLAVVRAIAPDADARFTLDALGKAVRDAAACDAPDLESMSRSAMGALLRQSGRVEDGHEAIRMAEVAEQRDDHRASWFRTVLAAAVVDDAAPQAERRAEAGSADADAAPDADAGSADAGVEAATGGGGVDPATADARAVDGTTADTGAVSVATADAGGVETATADAGAVDAATGVGGRLSPADHVSASPSAAATGPGRTSGIDAAQVVPGADHRGAAARSGGDLLEVPAGTLGASGTSSPEGDGGDPHSEHAEAPLQRILLDREWPWSDLPADGINGSDGPAARTIVVPDGDPAGEGRHSGSVGGDGRSAGGDAPEGGNAADAPASGAPASGAPGSDAPTSDGGDLREERRHPAHEPPPVHRPPVSERAAERERPDPASSAGWPVPWAGYSGDSPIGDLLVRSLRSGGGEVGRDEVGRDEVGRDEVGPSGEAGPEGARPGEVAPGASEPAEQSQDGLGRGRTGRNSEIDGEITSGAGADSAVNPGRGATDEASDESPAPITDAAGPRRHDGSNSPWATGSWTPADTEAPGVDHSVGWGQVIANGSAGDPEAGYVDDEGCTVAIDVARDGRRFAGRRAAGVLRAVSGRLIARLPTGARVRSEDQTVLAVVMPGWDQVSATSWMHRILPGLLEGYVSQDDLDGLHLRAVVHGEDGPIGAQLLQRLDQPGARDSTSGRGSDRRSAPHRGELNGAGTGERGSDAGNHRTGPPADSGLAGAVGHPDGPASLPGQRRGPGKPAGRRPATEPGSQRRGPVISGPDAAAVGPTAPIPDAPGGVDRVSAGTSPAHSADVPVPRTDTSGRHDATGRTPFRLDGSEIEPGSGGRRYRHAAGSRSPTEPSPDESGSPRRPDRAAPLHRPSDLMGPANHVRDSAGRAPSSDRVIPDQPSSGAASGSSGHASPGGVSPARPPSGRGPGDSEPSDQAPQSASPPGTGPDPTEGLGLADLLAGALAAYRGI